MNAAEAVRIGAELGIKSTAIFAGAMAIHTVHRREGLTPPGIGELHRLALEDLTARRQQSAGQVALGGQITL